MVIWDLTRVWIRDFSPQGHRFSFILRRSLFTRGDQTGERRAWSISWYHLRRCPPCNISGKRRKKSSEVFVGTWRRHALSRHVCIIVIIRHMFGVHTHTAPRQHARAHLLLCTWPTHGRLWPSIAGKHWDYISSDQSGAPRRTSATPLLCYFSYFTAKSTYFVANKH